MKSVKMIILVCGLFIFVTAALAAETCELCGMNLQKYAKTVHRLTFANGSQKSVCSIACASRMMRDAGEDQVRKIEASDYRSGKMINARRATYVEGSDAPPVMSMVSRVAFGSKADAAAFVKKHGGVAVDFDTALTRQREEDKKRHHGMKHKKH